MSPILQQIEGKFEILQKLKEGGMGAIYKVRHRLLDELRVVKVMRPHLAADASMRQRFLHEARIAIKVRHTNIAQLFDFTMDAEGTAMMVMEFIDGVTLQEVMADGSPPSLDLVIDIATQGLRGLSCLHRQGIVHRDISSDNLMLTRDFEGRPLVKLIDLGIAKDPLGATGATVQGMFMGKVRYSSPEQFGKGGGASLTPASDLYSFGVIFYELLTGRFPVEGESFAELAAGHLLYPPLPFEQSDPEARVPERLRALVLQMLAKDPAQRPSSADEIIEMLTSFPTAALDTAEFDRRLADARAVSAKTPDGGEGDSSQQLLNDLFPPVPTPTPPDPDEVDLKKTVSVSRQFELDRLCALLAPGVADLATSEIVATIDTMMPGRAVAPADDRTRRELEATLDWARGKEASGELEQALRGFEKAQRLSPHDASLQHSLVDLRRRLKVAREADVVLLRGLDHLARGELAQTQECLHETDRLSEDTTRSAPLREGLERAEAAEFQRLLDEAVSLSEDGEFMEALDVCARAAPIRPGDPRLPALETRIRSARDERVRTMADDCRQLLERAEADEDEDGAREQLNDAVEALKRLRAVEAGVGISAALVQEVGRVSALLEERRRERESRIAARRDQGLAELEQADAIVRAVDGDLGKALAYYNRARGLLVEVLDMDSSQPLASSAVERIDEVLPFVTEERARRDAREEEVADLLRRAAGVLGDAAGLSAVEESGLRRRLETLDEGRSYLKQARTLAPRHAKIRELTDRYAAFQLDTENELERRREERQRDEASRRKVLGECREISERTAQLASAGLTQVEQFLGEIEQAVAHLKQVSAGEAADEETASLLQRLRTARDDADRRRLALFAEDERQREIREREEQAQRVEEALDNAESLIREIRVLESRQELEPERVEGLLQRSFEQVERALQIEPDGQRALRTRQRLEDYAARLRRSVEEESRRRSREKVEAGLEQARGLADAGSHRKAIRHLEQVTLQCRAAVGPGDLLRDVEEALARSRAIVRKRLVRLTIVCAAALFFVVASFLAWKWATRETPLERELRIVSSLSETSEQGLRNKLVRYNELLADEKFSEHKPRLEAAKKRLVDLNDLQGRLNKLAQCHKDLEEELGQGKAPAKNAEENIRLHWGNFEAGFRHYADDPTAQRLRQQAKQEILEMAEFLASPQLRDLVAPP